MIEIRNVEKYLRLIVVIFFLLLGCSLSFAQEKTGDSDFKHWAAEKYDELYASRIYGSLIIQPSLEVDKNSEITIFDKAYKTNRLNFYMGDFRNRDIYDLILPSGNYQLNISTAGSIF
jgi:hypothetical protein